MRDSKVSAGIAAAVTLGAWVSVWLSISGGSPWVDRDASEISGRMVAEEALDSLGQGGELIVIARDTSVFKNPASDIQLATLKKTIQKAHAAIRSVVTMQVDPLRPVRVPPGDFAQLIARAPKGSVIVSLLGPPLLTQTQRAQLGEIKPSIVAFCSGNLPEQVDLRALFADGLLQAAVIERPGSGASGSASQKTRRTARRSFVKITEANMDALPSPAKM